MRKTRKELLAYLKELIQKEHPDDGDALKAVDEFEAVLDMEEILKRELYFRKANSEKVYVCNQKDKDSVFVGNKIFADKPTFLTLETHEMKLFFRFLHRDIMITKQRKLMNPNEPEV